MLVMYVVSKEVMDCVRKGDGLILIEVFIYCMGFYIIFDDFLIYRIKEEENEWVKKDLIVRFKIYLINKGYWFEEEDKKLEEEVLVEINDIFKKVESYGVNVELIEIFEYIYVEMIF